MKAEYNHWYKCQEGQMPEDFKNVQDNNVITTDGDYLEVNYRDVDIHVWLTGFQKTIAWMLPEPYKE